MSTLFDTDRLIDAIHALNASKGTTLPIFSNVKTVVGSVTDGDIRRALIRGLPQDCQINKFMNKNFLYSTSQSISEDLIAECQERGAKHIFLLDNNMHFLDIVSLKNHIPLVDASQIPPRTAVLMAGGKGTRLLPLTQTLPKPLVPVRGKPMIDHIINSLIHYGITHIIFSVNYLSEKIVEHIESSDYGNLSYSFVHETDPLGTAGSLGLLQASQLRDDFLVMNCDLINKVDITAFFEFHRKGAFDMTVGCIRHTQSVPFGVLSVSDSRITAIEEKPTFNYNVSAGMYILSPRVLDFIQPFKPLGMDVLIERLISAGLCLGAFPIFEQWSDVGTHQALESANSLR